MNVCYGAVSHLPSRTANSVHVAKMCDAYAALGHTVTLAVPAWRTGFEPGVADLYEFYGIKRSFHLRRVSLPFGRSNSLYTHFCLPTSIRYGVKPELVHARVIGIAWGASVVYKIPTIYELHDDPYSTPIARRSFNWLVRSRCLAGLVCITHALADHIRSLVPKRIRITVAPDGVDEEIVRQNLSQAQARVALGLEGERRRIAVYTGNLYRGRGIELILELARRVPEYLFLVVGGRAEELKHYRAQVGNSENIRFVGFVPPSTVPVYQAAADVLLMPHASVVAHASGGDIARYTSPIKMFEYLAAGGPIVASALPVLKEVLKHGVNALLLEYDDLNGWASALRYVASDKGVAGRLACRAKQDAHQYTWKNRAALIFQELELERSAEGGRHMHPRLRA